MLTYNHKRLNAKCLSSLLLCILIAGCEKDMHDHPELTTGKELFEFHCSGCHQSNGMGKFLNGIPKNNNTSLTFSQVVSKITSEDVKSSKIPIFKKMSKEEASKISAYLKSL